MKTAKILFVTMNIHLLFSIVLPVVLLEGGEGMSSLKTGFCVLYFCVIGLVLIMGLITIFSAIKLYRERDLEKLKEGWSLLKLDTVPFYLLNFLWSSFVWLLLLAASRGIMVFLLPIPMLITGAIIVESGVVGIIYIKSQRKLEACSNKPGKIHYLLQLFSVLDFISTIMILWQRDRDRLKEKLKRIPGYLLLGLAAGTTFFQGLCFRFSNDVMKNNNEVFFHQFQADKLPYYGVTAAVGGIVFLISIRYVFMTIRRKKEERGIEVLKMLSALLLGFLLAIFLWVFAGSLL